MSHATPVTTRSPEVPPAGRRPGGVTLASALLVSMGAAGLAYAVTTLVITLGVVRRFRVAAADTGASAADVGGFVTAFNVVAWIGLILALALAAVLVAASVGLRRGRRGARTVTWVICGLGLAGGLGAMLAVAVQRSVTSDLPGSGLGPAITAAYPAGWIGLNVALALAQVLGYAVVALSLATGSGTWFARPAAGDPPRPGGYPPPGIYPPPGGYPPPPGYPGSSLAGYPGIATGYPAPPAPTGPPPLPPDALDWARPADRPPVPAPPPSPPSSSS